MPAVAGRVKWFDATRGFGFLVSDELDGDVLLHFSVLREHGRRSLPEGALVECVPMRQERGLQARRVLSIDLSTRLAGAAQIVHLGRRAGRPQGAWPTRPGEFQPVEVKWFNRVKGYGFVNRGGRGARTCSSTWRPCASRGWASFSRASSWKRGSRRARKGLTAVELRAAH